MSVTNYVDAETNFNEVQSFVTTQAAGAGAVSGILPVLNNIAKKAAFGSIGVTWDSGGNPDAVEPITTAVMAAEVGSTEMDSFTATAPSEPAVDASDLTTEFLGRIAAYIPESVSFPEYSELITTEPSLPTFVDIPADVYSLSDVEDPTYTLPAWDETVWSAGGEEAMGYAQPVQNVFDYTADSYVSPFYSDGVDQLYAALIAEISDGSYGIGEDVEAELFDRGVDRETKMMLNAVEGALNLFSAGGFQSPTGAAAAAIARVQAETRDKMAGVSREILAKRADQYLEAKKLTWSITQQAEAAYQQYWNALRDRYLKRLAQEITSTIEVASYNLERVKIFVERYKAYAQGFSAQVDGAKGVVQLFQSRVEAEKTKSEANKAVAEKVISQNKALVDRFMASVESYKAAIDGRVKYHGALADLYKAEADIYSAQVGGVKEAYGVGDKKEANLVNFRIGKYQNDIARSKVKLDEIIGYLGLKVDQFKQQAQQMTTIATAAMNALSVNLSMNLGASVNLGGSDSYSWDQTATATRHSQSTQHSTSTSDSRQWSTSESTSEQTTEYKGEHTVNNINTQVG